MNFLEEGILLLKIIGPAAIIAHLFRFNIKTLLTFFAFFIAYVFRDEARIAPTNENCIVCPCDGKVSEISQEIIEGNKFVKIAIENGIVDCKFLLSPVKGEMLIKSIDGNDIVLKINNLIIKHEVYNNNIINENFNIKFLTYKLSNLNISKPYGSFFYIKKLYIYIPADKKIVTKKGQIMVAGESIIGEL